MKSVLPYVLVKQLQVFYGYCLFKYPKEKSLLHKLHRPAKYIKNKHSANKATATENKHPGEIPSRISLALRKIMRSQTHSLSMEKQVTGPSALQVAVLKISLQEGKQCTHVSLEKLYVISTYIYIRQHPVSETFENCHLTCLRFCCYRAGII